MAGDEVRVVYRKYDGELHWHETKHRLGEDEHGVWLGAAPGTVARRGEGYSIVAEHAHVHLFPRNAWWTAVFHAAPYRLEIYCDVTTPPLWPHPGEVTMVDLDLDVCRMRGRWRARVRVLDEDEFAEHRVRYRYPPEVIAQALDATRWLRRALADGTQPFAGGYRSWLDRFCASL